MYEIEPLLQEKLFENYRRLQEKLTVGLSDELLETFGYVEPQLYDLLLRLRWFEYQLKN